MQQTHKQLLIFIYNRTQLQMAAGYTEPKMSPNATVKSLTLASEK